MLERAAEAWPAEEFPVCGAKGAQRGTGLFSQKANSICIVCPPDFTDESSTCGTASSQGETLEQSEDKRQSIH